MKEVLKLALEALERFEGNKKLWPEAITAIKEALANDALEKKAENARELGLNYEPEPVAWMCADESLINKGYARFSHVCMGDWKIPVYTTKPQRTWVGLKDDDEIDWDGGDLKSFVRAIEAKLKEKNNG